jgi:hypothetical protein
VPERSRAAGAGLCGRTADYSRTVIGVTDAPPRAGAHSGCEAEVAATVIGIAPRGIHPTRRHTMDERIIETAETEDDTQGFGYGHYYYYYPYNPYHYYPHYYYVSYYPYGYYYKKW